MDKQLHKETLILSTERGKRSVKQRLMSGSETLFLSGLVKNRKWLQRH